jgi:nucleoside 2-deoxyribosyltransferase
MKVYLSGPMSGIPDENFPAFNAAARALHLIGYKVVNPAEFNTDVTGLEGRARWVKFLKVDIKALVDCDGIVMLPGWEDSEGAKLEHSTASALDIPVMTLAEAVIEAPNLTWEPSHA